jgi:hypothetical protein
MNEKAFWANHVRKALHQPPSSVAWKIQDMYNAGLPDVAYIIDGRTGFLELKRVPAWPKRASSLVPLAATREQRRQLLEGREAGGACFLLLSVGKEWFLLDPLVLEARSWRARVEELNAWATEYRRGVEDFVPTPKGPVIATGPLSNIMWLKTVLRLAPLPSGPPSPDA